MRVVEQAGHGGAQIQTEPAAVLAKGGGPFQCGPDSPSVRRAFPRCPPLIGKQTRKGGEGPDTGTRGYASRKSMDKTHPHPHTEIEGGRDETEGNVQRGKEKRETQTRNR